MKTTYVRVSTFEQNISRQREGKSGEVYWNKISGMVPFKDRPNSPRCWPMRKMGRLIN